ncbi:MAG: hypothetical protein LUM44_19495 [Pyrinomonadaceae bacterium]|nr:hypothetical protein [Pyrinomonadaceae bacterium]
MKRAAYSILLGLIIVINAFGQSGTNENGADRTLRGSGRVNPSTLGMEIEIPLGNYPGRGINVPVNLSYSSKLWRMEVNNYEPQGNNPSNCRAINHPKYAEKSASGWTTSMGTPYIEYIGEDNIFKQNGKSSGETSCVPETPGNNPPNAYVRRVMLNLPSGETHELRMDDTVKVYPNNQNCADNDPNTLCDANDPSRPENWSGWYYAVDGSNIKYFEDRVNNVYFLQMPDGSRYEFVNNKSAFETANIRKAHTFIDRNGNFTSFNEPTTQYPNGYWTDTLGKPIGVPMGLNEPSQPTVQTYNMPGMTGTYKFSWKKLKGDTAADSGLTDFNLPLRHPGDNKYTQGEQPYPADTYLFQSKWESVVRNGSLGEYFNPVVLTEIELPTGEKYKFTYDIYGRIEQVVYPMGGKELFQFQLVPTLSVLERDDVSAQTNFGVTNRKVFYGNAPSNYYEWTYSAQYVAPKGYKVSIKNPDDTQVERFLHRGKDSSPLDQYGNFGYDEALAGMAYEERAFSSAGKIVSRKLIHWTKTELWTTGDVVPVAAHWHPRVTHEEIIGFDELGNGVSSTVKSEYQGDLNLRETPLMVNKTKQYAFVPIIASSSLSGGGNLFAPGEPPAPNPAPVPTPEPPTLLKTNETTYLQNDPNISQGVKDVYKNQNMIGLATASTSKDGAGTIVYRSEMAYDEIAYQVISTGSHSRWQNPNNSYRGNPTTSRVWDSGKGTVSNAAAYIATHAQFDNFGNQVKVWDAKGNMTETQFSATYGYAFPTQVTTAVPDPSGQNGSETAFVSSATFDPTNGLPLSTTNANGLETRIEYDPVTLRRKNTKTFYQYAQVGGVSETIYHDEPNNYWVKSRSQIDANRWAENITYLDGLGRAYKSEEVNSKGNIFVEKEFDADGRLYRVTNPFRNGEAKVWTTNIYDNASRVIEVVLPDGAKVKTDYGVSVAGVVGVTKQITDQAGKKRKGISDGLGRMVRVIEDPTGQNLATDYVFDTLGNLRKTIQGEQSRYFTYDSLGRLRFAKQPEQESNTSFNFTDPLTNNSSWSVKYEYDDNGNITNTMDARGVSVAGTYDNLNRLKLRNYSDDTPDVNFYYDGKGLPSVPNFAKGKTTRITNSVSETRYTSFDNLGRLLTHEQITDGKTYPTAYQYNLSGAITSETYPSGRVMTYNLDADGSLESLWGQKADQTSAKLYLNQISYNSSGNIERMRLGNGRWETAAYNNRQQIVQIGLGYSNNDKSLLKIDYAYGTNLENNGSLREQKINFYGLTNEIKQTYTYDDLNRLKSSTETVNAQVAWKQTFNYDRYGNRTLDAGNTTTLTQSVSQKIANPLINTADNRLQKDQDNDNISDYVYDKAGNLTVDAANQRFIYDAENRMKEYFHSTNQTNTPDAVYQYDGEGKRVKKVSGNNQTIFVYNSSGQLIAEYANPTASNPQVSYLTQDHLGSPRIITGNNGEVISRHDYMAFGADISETLGNVGNRATAQGYGKADQIRTQYTGYEHDDESGLDFAQARYYNSSHGRFTSVDPLTASASIKDPQTFNRYTYAMNSPYKFTDPLGLISSKPMKYKDADEDEIGTIAGDTIAPTEAIASGETKAEAEPPPPPPPPAPNAAPDELIAEALLAIANVKVVVPGGDDVEGTIELTPEMTEAITKALNDAFLAGDKVGAAAKVAGDKVILVGGVTGEESAVGPSLSLSDLGIQGSQSKYQEKNYEKAASAAIKMDLDELANNSGRAKTVAGALQNTEVTVVSSNSTVKKVEKLKATAEYGFWNAAVAKQVDLIYRRGVRMGYENTNAKPSLGPVVPKK